MKLVARGLLLAAVLSLAALPTLAQTDAQAPVPGLQLGGATDAPDGIGEDLTPPAIAILGFNSTDGDLCDTSGGSVFFNLDIYLAPSDRPSYDCSAVSVDGVGQVSAPFCEDLTGIGFPPGVYTYGLVVGAPYTVAPGTLVTAKILTYAGAGGSGRLNFISTAVFPCDDPTSITITNTSGVAQSIPTLGALGLVALALALGGLSLLALRRKRSALS